jgi:hypothetical protein
MPKLAWIVLLVAISGGAASCYLLHRPGANPEVSETTTPVPRTLPHAERDEEMLRRKLEGIGRARDLKPVPLPPPGSH